MTTHGKYRILSLDGGGAWSLIQVMALQQIYSQGRDIGGHDLLSNFDLVAANSGGSIIAAALAEGLTLSQILDIFNHEANIRNVFVDLPWYKKLHPLGLAGIGPRYSTSAKLEGLKGFLPKIKDEELRAIPQIIFSNTGKEVHFLITAFDYDRQRAVFFRSNEGSLSGNFPKDNNIKMVDAIHASSTAPINYFDEPAEISDYPVVPDRLRFWDGAVGAYNNPVLAAVTEALANGNKSEDIVVLSIGTGSVFLPLEREGETEHPALVQKRETPSLIKDVKKMATSIMDDPPDAATFISHVVLGQRLPAFEHEIPVTDGSVIRMNPLIQPIKKNGRWAVPDGLGINDFEALVQLDMDAMNQTQIDTITRFCTAWLNNGVPNQPVRANRNLICEIGHDRFLTARANWINLIS